MPKISVVMPVYNGEAYLREAIDSVIAQTFTDWELIIVNEFGSNREATAILKEYEAHEPRIRVIQNAKRLGIAESLNVGLRAATGEFIARMDGDDRCGLRRFEKQLDFLESHPEIDVCGIEVSMFGDSAWDWVVYCQPDYLNCACLFYTPFVHPTIMLRTKSLRDHQLEYDCEFTYTEDFDFFVRASEFLRFENIKDRELYHYRFTANNATNVGGQKGIQFQHDVMARTFRQYHLDLTVEEIALLSPNTNQGLNSTEKALRYLEELDMLLKKVFLHKELQDKYGLSLLFQVLHRRWMDAYEQIRWKDAIMGDGQALRAIERGLFYREDFWKAEQVPTPQKTPMVSIVLPTYNSEDYILDTIYSLLDQDFTDFELLVMNELGSDDRTVECVSMFRDPRIHIIQNTTRLGLAQSLNVGIRAARGKYIARADADDLYPRDRLRKQVVYMEEHPEISVCGSWQRHFGQRNYIHMPPTTPEEMKANLLFKCEVCHSTIMLRKESVLQHDLWYDNSYLSEDYELWCRASSKISFATIPEVLGEYRWNGDNITAQKMDRLDIEAQKLVARNLKDHLGMEIRAEDLILLSGWKNPFYESNPDYVNLRIREAALLNAISERNREVGAFDESALETVLNQRRAWAFIEDMPPVLPTAEEKSEAIPAFAATESPVVSYMDGTVVYEVPRQEKRSGGFTHRIKMLVKQLLKPFYQPFRHRYEDRLIAIEESVWKQEGIVLHLQQKISDLDGHVYDYCRGLQNALDLQMEKIAQLQEIPEAMHKELEELQHLMKRYTSGLEAQIQAVSWTMEEHLGTRIADSQMLICQKTAERMEAAEQLICRNTAERMEAAEQLICRNTADRVSTAEKLIAQTMDTRIWNAEKLINQTTDARLGEAEKQIRRNVDDRISDAERTVCRNVHDDLSGTAQRITQTMDTRVWNAEKTINQATDTRIWNMEKLLSERVAVAEQSMNQTMDARVWKAEESINQTMDARIRTSEKQLVERVDCAKQEIMERIGSAEQSVNQTTDTRIWDAEKTINQTTDTRVWKSELLLDRRMKEEGRIWECRAALRDTSRKRIFLIGTPEHQNIGDAAITLGELEFIKQYFPDYIVVEISTYEFEHRYEALAAEIREDDLIFLQGGGNLGNRYLNEEAIRRRVIKDFPNNRIVILPQTIYFEPTAEGEKELRISQEIYNQHSDLKLMARGMHSLKEAGEYFPNIKAMCALDLALMLKTPLESSRRGILLCLRDLGDESGLTEDEHRYIQSSTARFDPDFEQTNNYYQNEPDSNIYCHLRRKIVFNELRRFASHKVVVTDRLHGLIFAVITKTPCVLISSYNQKIPEFFELLKDSNAIFFVDRNIRKLDDAITQALKVDKAIYPAVSEDAFGKMYQMITEN